MRSYELEERERSCGCWVGYFEREVGDGGGGEADGEAEGGGGGHHGKLAGVVFGKVVTCDIHMDLGGGNLPLDVPSHETLYFIISTPIIIISRSSQNEDSSYCNL